MRTVGQFLEALRKIELPVEMEIALMDSREDYADLQREQLADGLRKDEQYIYNLETGSDEYSPSYARYKGKKGPIDLRDTGSFYNDIVVDVRSEGLVIDSADSKSEMLQERYGEEIFGLGDDRKKEFLPVVRDRLIENMTKEMNR